MKGDTYEYEGQKFILESKYFNEYVVKTEIDLQKIYSAKEATEIMNKHIMKCYRGLVTCGKELSGRKICEVLSDIEEQFLIRCKVICNERDEN
jgi:CO dehydrogenase/acetyl-CoA synthase epsilon subunit